MDLETCYEEDYYKDVSTCYTPTVFTVTVLTNISKQTVQEQFDQSLHCLPFCEIEVIKWKILGKDNYGIFWETVSFGTHSSMSLLRIYRNNPKYWDR